MSKKHSYEYIFVKINRK